MARKIPVLFAFAAFVVAWLSGLAASVPPDTILVRSLGGAAGFYLLGSVLCRVAATYLDLPDDSAAADEQSKSEEQRNAAEQPTAPARPKTS